MTVWIVIILLLLWGIVSYNTLVRKDASCDEAFASMDVYMKKRFDLIPNLVETVKGYSKHEAETLCTVVEARNAGTGSVEALKENEEALSGALRQVFALAEAYPELKADESYRQLMKELSRMEQEICASRRFYNALVKEYNVSCRRFPEMLVAKLFGFKEKPMFEIEDPLERENVKVSF